MFRTRYNHIQATLCGCFSQLSPVRTLADATRRLAILTLMPAIWFCLFSLSPALSEPVKKNVLILNSYHVGYKWSDDIYKGIMASLSSQLSRLNLYVEYMDTKRYSSPAWRDILFKNYREKYNNIPIHLIIASDDNAVNFLKKRKNALFPGAMVVFCGANYIEESQIQNHPDFIGVAETPDIRATIDTALKLHPKTSHLYVIVDQTTSGNRVRDVIGKLILEYRTAFSFLDEPSMEALLTTVSNLPENSLLLYAFFAKDKRGKLFEFDESATLITSKSRAPVYTAWDFNLGYGVVGGMMVSGYLQGVTAGTMALGLIRGKAIHDFPRISTSPNQFLFDYRELKKFNIDPSRLPPGSRLVNKPVTFYEKHRMVLLFSGGCILFLLFFIFILTINILRRKKVEKALRRSEHNFRGIFDNATEGLFQVTPAGRFLNANPALAKILKCDSPAETMALYSDIPTRLYENREDLKKILTLLKEKGKVTDFETRMACKDKQVIHVSINVHNIHDETGQLLYYEGSVTDITEKKKTRELIIQTEKMMSVGGVAAGMAHEIKSPLGGIIQNIQVLKNRLLKDLPQNIKSARESGFTLDSLRNYTKKRQIDNIIETIMDAGNRAVKIIENMLSFSRKSNSELKNHNLAELMEETLSLLSKKYKLSKHHEPHAIRVKREFEPPHPLVPCDRSKIQQVFFNILKNGSEAMMESHTENPSLTVRIIKEKEAVRIEIEDNGPGMDENTRKRVFEPFFTTRGEGKGTGLGLSVSYFIVTEDHGGTITVESTPGKGTKFVVRLPLTPSEK